MRNLLQAFLLTSAAMLADPVFTLDQPAITASIAQPGSWTFRLASSATEWLSITASFLLFETNPSTGIYLDSIGAGGGPTGSLAAGAPDWTGTMGTFHLNPGTPIGSYNAATVLVLYDRFSADPAACGGLCYLGSGQFDANVSVTAAASVPEGSAFEIAGSAMVLLCALKRAARQGQRSSKTFFATKAPLLSM